MIRRLVPAAAGAILGALSAAVLTTMVYAWSATLVVDFGVDPPRQMSGVFGSELDVPTRLTYAWTGREVALRLPAIDRRVPWTVQVRLRGAQPDGSSPTVSFFVDGVRTLVHESTNDFTTPEIVVPPRADGGRGLLVTMQVSKTFVPGPNDPRSLGVLLDLVHVTPDGLVIPPRNTLAAAVGSAAVFGAAIGLLGVAAGLAMGGAVVLAAAQALVLTRGFGPFTPYPDKTPQLGMAIAAALVLIVVAIEAIGRRALRNTARFAAAFTAAALFLKLLVQLHPGMPIGDALFQARKFHDVLRGTLFFTSIAPGNYLFPYPPGLYVFAMPFADGFGRDLADVAVLRIVVACTDAAAALLLYWVVARGWNDRLAAAGACAIYQLLPLDFLVAAGGTLTSAFAQSVAVVAVAAMASALARKERPLGLAALTLVMSAAFLSHTSTFAMLAATGMTTALLLLWRGGPPLRSTAWGVAICTVVAVAIAVGVYYIHFMDVYRTELARIGSETAAAAPDAGGRSIADRARVVPLYLYVYYGIPALMLTSIGAVSMWRQGRRDALTLTTAALAVTCMVFLAIGVATPVDMRYYVAALPAIAVASAAGAAAWWNTGGAPRIAVVALLAWTIVNAMRTWVGTLR